MPVALTPSHSEAAAKLIRLFVTPISDDEGQFDPAILISALACLAGSELHHKHHGPKLARKRDGQSHLSKAVSAEQAESLRFLKWVCEHLKLDLSQVGEGARLESDVYPEISRLNHSLAEDIEEIFVSSQVPAQERVSVCLLAAAKAVQMSQSVVTASEGFDFAAAGFAYGSKAVPFPGDS